MTKNKIVRSPIKQKVLLLLQAGLALSLSPSLNKQLWIFKQLSKEWARVDRQYLYRIIREFKSERLISWNENKDGTIVVILTKKGKKKALRFHINKMKIKKPTKWDGKWRMVFFDIPEKNRRSRDALRSKLKNLGFYELQKSVFIYPFSCKNEIDFIVEFFEVRNNVSFTEIISISNEAKLKLHFGLK